ncbi:peptidoglycan editing factor PgeF [Macrococcus sp. DPC7161]|uniref:peptidoglycan editing factor PgeF n=1 Tax=Macrococcus sp. DPC7161 TaxID=2507060 RepID=UPI00100BEDD4|nr:peptidoglycan editing factor PgeF [Macrococcus sp. DPC7161]RXK18892.1 peptidoglycan editing factor PgeF [Macrococcus sp. DPC7161]
MEPFKLKEHVFLSDQKENLVLGITARHGGISQYPNHSLNMAHYIDDTTENVIKNQEVVADLINFDRLNWVFPIQTHENKIVEVHKSDKGTNIDCLTDKWHGIDGLYTYEKDVLLTMCYADCVPVYIHSKKDDFVALGHAGWRGTVGLILKKLIEAYKGDVKDLHVTIGPSVTSKNYLIDDFIKNQFDALNMNLESYFVRSKDLYEINLQGINAKIAQLAGVPEAQILITSRCTTDQNEHFFSYRLEKGKTGRMLAFIGMRDF